MSTEDSVAKQRSAVNVIFVLFAGFLTLMWAATFLDYALKLGWEMDSRMLWGAPLLVGFATALRFVAFAIFRFVEANY